jgi:hypothetical protein
MDFSDPPEARSVITYTCNDQSIRVVKNQVWRYYPQNMSLINGNNYGCITALPGGGAGVRACDASNPSQRVGLDGAVGEYSAIYVNVTTMVTERMCLEWGGQGTMLSQATLLVNRVEPLLSGVSGEQVMMRVMGVCKLWIQELSCLLRQNIQKTQCGEGSAVCYMGSFVGPRDAHGSLTPQ